MMTRRQAIQRLTLAAASAGTFALAQTAAPAAPADAGASGPFKLPPLPFAFDALEPYLDARTMEIHHDKHHAAYVQNLNKAVSEHPALAAKPVEELLRDLTAVPEKIRAAVRNHGGGHANHSLFWQCLQKNEADKPAGPLASAIDKAFGSYATFQQEFTRAALGVFGSGWAWLTLEAGNLRIETTPNQDTPLSQQRFPLLTLDVWEHAYYLKYQNRRADYVAAFYKVIHWEFVGERYRSARA